MISNIDLTFIVKNQKFEILRYVWYFSIFKKIVSKYCKLNEILYVNFEKD